jgi:hypothetical protein
MADPIKQLTELMRKEGLPTTGKSAIDWYRKSVTKLEEFDRGGIFRNRKKLTKLRRGEMYMFRYIAKGRSELKYYDQYPLVLVYQQELENNYFRGLNLHYLPHKHRVVFFANLQSVVTNTKYDDETRLRITSNMISGMTKYRYGRVCFRTYSLKQIRSKIIKIPSNEWFASLFLPSEKFVPSSRATAWKDSRRKLNENR